MLEEASAQRRRCAVRQDAAAGRAVGKQSPLHRILAVRDGPAVVRDSEVVAAKVAEFFSHNWAPRGAEWQDTGVRSAAERPTDPPVWTAQQIGRAAAKLRAPQRVDHGGVAPLALLGAAEAVPEAVCAAFAELVGLREARESNLSWLMPSARSLRAHLLIASGPSCRCRPCWGW